MLHPGSPSPPNKDKGLLLPRHFFWSVTSSNTVKILSNATSSHISLILIPTVWSSIYRKLISFFSATSLILLA
jgi:hypothetical protein